MADKDLKDSDFKNRKILEGEILRDAEGNAETNEGKVRAGFWAKLAKAADNIPFLEELVAGYYCALDPQTPTRVRAMLLAALAYFILPLDSIPDFLIGFGYTDDIAILTAVLAAIRSSLKETHFDAAREKISELKSLSEKDDGQNAA